MQKGVFNTWLKELCALVFLQTIQAFVLAIVLSIILTFLVPGGGAISDHDTVSALGVLCIVLLSSLTKIEQITKKIFGLESGFLQNKPPHGLITSYLALKAAGRALNNIPKVASGVGKIVGGGLDKKKAMNANLKRLSRAGLGIDGTPLPEEQGVPEGRDDSGSTGSNNAGGENATRGESGSTGGRDVSPRPIGTGSASGTVKKPASKDVSKDYWKIMDKYDDELAKAKEKRREGIKELSSGLLETGGAITGALGGAAVGLSTGLAMGDLDQIPKAIGFGVGAGDKLGEMTVNAVDTVQKQVSNIKKAAKTTEELNDNLGKMERNLKIQREGKIRAATRFKAIQNEIKKTNNINDI